MARRPKLPNEFLNLVRPGANRYFRPSKGEEWEKEKERAERRPTLASTKTTKNNKK